MKTILSLATLLIVLATAAHAGQPWRLVRTVDSTAIVLMDVFDAKNPALYREAARELCKGKQACKVLFWSDESLLPEKLPLTDAQTKGVTASWFYDGATGTEQLSTSFDPATDSGDCQ